MGMVIFTKLQMRYNSNGQRYRDLKVNTAAA
jgi:hypothetical protein